LNLAPLIAAELGVVSPQRSDLIPRWEEFRPTALAWLEDSTLRQLFAGVVTPLSAEEADEGAAGMLRVDRAGWGAMVAGIDRSEGDPEAGSWMEAAEVDGDDLLVYPNDAEGDPRLVVFAPVRIGPQRLLLLRLVLFGAAPHPQVQSDPCTLTLEGELRERKVVCTTTGCLDDCLKAYRRKDGVQILECRC
jgi:hypothetical protein